MGEIIKILHVVSIKFGSKHGFDLRVWLENKLEWELSVADSSSVLVMLGPV